MGIIDRSGAETLICDERAESIIDAIKSPDTLGGSAMLKLAKRLPNMSSRQKIIPLVSRLPVSYWQDGASFEEKDTADKKLTDASFEGVTLTAEELAAIVLIPENCLDDAETNLWEHILPLISDALGAEIDRAILWGFNGTGGIIQSASAAGNAIVRGSDLYGELLGKSGILSLIEGSGYIPNGYIAKIRARSYFRRIRNNTGKQLFRKNPRVDSGYSLDGVPVHFSANGVLENGDALIVGGDFKQLLYSIRQDVSIKLLDQATVKDDSTGTLYHLAQQDMVGIRVKMRIAWAIPNPVNRIGNRYPFAVLKEAEGASGFKVLFKFDDETTTQAYARLSDGDLAELWVTL
ncbi:hypothetical protein AGMMS49975_00020 [Clostridia bacterium]|nr:hypothetical protein AGMMS49975_00020 [Clostridia bacterium]